MTPRMASVRTDADWGVDYIHLAKLDGDWKVVNVLWDGATDQGAHRHYLTAGWWWPRPWVTSGAGQIAGYLRGSVSPPHRGVGRRMSHGTCATWSKESRWPKSESSSKGRKD